MKFETHLYSPKDFCLLESWWKAKNFPVADPELLPPTGFIVTGDSVPICAGFLFKTDAKIAILNHVVASSSPMDKEDRNKAMNLLISRVILEARRGGFKILSAACNIDRLGKRYESLGFVKTDSVESHYGRVL